ncbi:MAG: homocysteine S-methyltransferase family protein, partial [Phascolarctobacterium sp.]|nr:homocysteine S-methyltransferase family protein [Phascolarctobacterium sp.]
MLTRIITGAIGAVAAIGIITTGGWVFSLAVFILSAIGWYEYHQIAAAKGKNVYYLTSGLGSLLIAEGLQPGDSPENWNIERPEVLRDIHARYFNAGADFVMANTCGANRIKLKDCKYSLEETITAAIKNAKSAGKGRVALDVGPTGKLLKPLGDLEFEDAVSVFAEVVKIG